MQDGAGSACKGVGDSTGDARSEREANLPWRPPVLSQERRVTWGSVQHSSLPHPANPRWIFSQALPCLQLSSCGQGGGSWKLTLLTHRCSELAFVPVTGQLAHQPSWGPVQLQLHCCHPSPQALRAAALMDVARLVCPCSGQLLASSCCHLPAAAFCCPALSSGACSVLLTEPAATGVGPEVGGEVPK